MSIEDWVGLMGNRKLAHRHASSLKRHFERWMGEMLGVLESGHLIIILAFGSAARSECGACISDSPKSQVSETPQLTAG